jgi:cytochrome b561
MRSSVERYNSFFTILHWISALLVVILLGLGWSLEYIPAQREIAREFVLDLHTSFGLTAVVPIVLMIVLRLVFKPPPYPIGVERKQKVFYSVTYILIYISLILMLISGWLLAAASGGPVQFWGAQLRSSNAADLPLAEALGHFWGAPLHIWGASSATLTTFFEATHGLAAVALAVLIVAHIGTVAINSFKYPGFGARMVPHRVRATRDNGEPKQQPRPSVSKIAEGLARNLRLFGWLGFWVQLVLALLTGLLLEFATSGRAFSPSAAGGFGDALYWGIDGFLLLILAVLLALYYPRAARKLVSRPEYYLSRSLKSAFWFLGAGMLTAISGVIIAFTGVALSISLLVVKTVSQPPGIAITDPNRIIRALDVFVLIVNFNLLMAHFIGAGMGFWLIICAARSHLKYAVISRQENNTKDTPAQSSAQQSPPA